MVVCRWRRWRLDFRRLRSRARVRWVTKQWETHAMAKRREGQAEGQEVKR
jgi:hypothetical protein